MPRLEGKSIEEIVNQYASEHQIDRGEITYTIVEEKKGLLGIGGKVVVDIQSSVDIKDFLYNYLNDYFEALGLEVSIEVTKDNSLYKVTLNSDNNAMLIGKNGNTLQALNTLIKGAASNNFKRKIQVLVDINNYKEQRYQRVELVALRVAKSVQRSKQEALLDPMPNDERKVVHQYLSHMRHIRTASEGEGRDRRIRIIYDESCEPEEFESKE